MPLDIDAYNRYWKGVLKRLCPDNRRRATLFLGLRSLSESEAQYLEEDEDEFVVCALENAAASAKQPPTPSAVAEDAREELEAYQKASSNGDRDVLACNHLVGPLESIELMGSAEGIGEVNRGLLMPLYAATLEHVTSPLPDTAAIKVGTQVNTALNHLHSLDLGDNDIKPPNIFLDGTGDCHLGDYGAVRVLGAAADQQTKYMVPSGTPFDPFTTSKKLDKCLLAITLLGKLDLLRC